MQRSPIHIPLSRSREYLAYGWSDALGDIGGMVGMLLGASCLALSEAAIDRGSRGWGKKRRVAAGKGEEGEGAKE